MSFTLNYTGDEINAILARANNGGEIDDELALKAPLASPALTGTPTAPTQAEGDDSTKIATTEYADRAADAAGAAAEAAAKEYTDAATSALYITDTASGSIAIFSDGADGIPMRSVKVAITPVQSGSGDPSPDNVRPISGWTGAEVVRTGKNLFDKTAVTANYHIDSSGQPFAQNGYSLSDWIKVKPSASYVRTTSMATNTAAAIYDANKNFIQRITSGNVITTTADTMYMRMAIVSANIDAEQLELGSTATAYEPYAGTTFPVTWQTQAGTVYGGTIDVVSGELKVTHARYQFVGTESVSELGTSDAFSVRVPVMPIGSAYAEMPNIISDRFATVARSVITTASITDGVSLNAANSSYIILKKSGITTAAEMTEYLTAQKNAGTPVEVCYKMASSQVYQLDAQQIASLLGQNHVWSNTGDTEVTYVADPKLYIDKRITELFAALSQ